MKTSEVVDIRFKNESGIQPVDNRVLVESIKTEEITKGGIVLTSETTDKENRAHTKARLIAKGYQAFEDITDPDFRPKEGSIVLTARYAGALFLGKDEKEYRLINDKDIVAVLDGDFEIRIK